MPVKLADLVETSRLVSETSKRTAKTDELASLLRRLAANEIDIGVAYLSGFPLQPKTGIGYASLRDAGADLTLIGSGAPGFAGMRALDLAVDRGNDDLVALLDGRDSG